jgi:hypothetical protein
MRDMLDLSLSTLLSEFDPALKRYVSPVTCINTHRL